MLRQALASAAHYKISKPSVYLAVKAALAAAPRHEADEYRELQTDRCEEMLFALQPGIRAGSPSHVSSAVKVLQHQADLQGLLTPDPNPGLQAFQIIIDLGDTPDETQQDAIEASSWPHIDDSGDE